MFKIFLFCVILLSSASAYVSFCMQPSEPYCVNNQFTYDDKYSFESCKREVEKYLKDLEEYVVCVANEAQEQSVKTINKFNCYASGKSFCY